LPTIGTVSAHDIVIIQHRRTYPVALASWRVRYTGKFDHHARTKTLVLIGDDILFGYASIRTNITVLDWLIFSCLPPRRLSVYRPITVTFIQKSLIYTIHVKSTKVV